MLTTLKTLYSQNQWPFFTEPYDLNVFGIRVSGHADTWDDTLACAFFDGKRWVLKRWIGSTTPGVHYLQTPMTSMGCLVVAPTYHKSLWQLGTHTGYPALQQVGTLTYWRDNDRDAQVDETQWITGTGNAVNGHHGYDSKYVGRNSAGCQVWRFKEHLTEMLELVKKQDQHGHGSKVSYTLFDTAKTPKAAELALKTEIAATSVFE